jgi:hypothetical protein
MLMVLLGIMVSQSISLLAGCVADAGERLVESKLSVGLRFGAASWRGGKDGLLLECDGLDCGMFVEDGGGFGRLKGGLALAPDLALKRLGGLLRLIFLIGLDPVLRDWWLLRLVNASWLGISSTRPTTDALLLRRWWRTCVLGSCGGDSLQ